MFKRNHLLFGLLLSLVLTMATFALLFTIDFYVSQALEKNYILSIQMLLIFSIAMNFFPLNYYTKAKAFGTARGIMISVFLFALCYVYITFFI